ncbi:hypothetical protein ABEG90_06910 [Pantoea agglomerans]|uniref:hypothetical protein n=1 Tax=Enterobacter agglomerans TaxID=549 RepID=UPI003209BE2F
MAKHLTNKDLQIIINCIAGWQSSKQGKFTWENLCDSVTELLGKRPTRQSLSQHTAIVRAFELQKKNIKSGASEVKRPANLNIASQQIRNLQLKNESLKEEVRVLKQQFIIWQFNAYKYGIKEYQLNAPLMPVDREKTDKE